MFKKPNSASSSVVGEKPHAGAEEEGEGEVAKPRFSIAEGLDQADSELIQKVRDGRFFVPPSTRPYNLTSEKNPSMGQAQLIEMLFKEVR